MMSLGQLVQGLSLGPKCDTAPRILPARTRLFQSVRLPFSGFVRSPQGGSAVPTPIKCAVVMLALFGSLAPASMARAGANPDVHLALDVMSKTKTQSCASLAGRYLSCDSIRTALPDTGNFRVAVVVYDVTSVTGVQYALSWPEDWDIQSFSSCGSLVIGGDTGDNPDGRFYGLVHGPDRVWHAGHYRRAAYRTRDIAGVHHHLADLYRRTRGR